MAIDFEKEALAYHSQWPRGKVFTGISKPLETQTQLSLAYTPGVAGPCRAIAKNEQDSFLYTGRGNLVAVITNGTAVLGLGDIGPYAAKPVMEGKVVLFKKFANIDAIDLELNASNADDFIQAVATLEPSVGGINLEDIKAPECFYIEETLRARMKIPVFHDDQHGTSIIAGAAFINALEISHRKLETVKVVFSGGGAAAIACASLFIEMGVKKENLIMCDSKGVLHSERTDLNPYKQRFALKTNLRTMAEALKGADAFVGVSTANILTPEMLISMAANPIVFALSNPDPEIHPELALKTRSDVILATGRSDYPNQVNNVLGFPFIFRGALDVRATTINEAMKLAAVKAIAELAKEDVPDEVMRVYNPKEGMAFGRDYLIPKPVDPRVLLKVAPAVARAAVESGVARQKIDLDKYEEHLEHILGPARVLQRKVKKDIFAVMLKRGKSPLIAITRASDSRVVRAANHIVDEGGVRLALIGQEKEILETAEQLKIRNFREKVEIFDPFNSEQTTQYAKLLVEQRKRHGVTNEIAHKLISDPNYFASVLLKSGRVDGLVNGLSEPYHHAIRPIMEVVGVKAAAVLSGLYLVMAQDKLLFFADCSINVTPSSEQLACIALQAAEQAKLFTKDTLRVAMLSFASFGANPHPDARRIKNAVAIAKQRAPHLILDGEMQVDVALDTYLQEKEFPFCELKGLANVLVFPDLNSANIACKLVAKISDAISVGPLLSGMKKPAQVMQRGATINEIISMIYLTAQQVEA
ncbi:MAG: NADP-dependent malic enzyme [Oligoflexales bacterium]|nr:NADP-dependent malic enzyme [Oligoflexales bacterium]